MNRKKAIGSVALDAENNQQRSRSGLTRLNECFAWKPLRSHASISTSRIKDALRVQFLFDRPKRGSEKLGTLTVVPGPVVTANRVVMRDRTTSLDQSVARRILDCLPLLQKRPMATERVEGEIGRGPSG